MAVEDLQMDGVFPVEVRQVLTHRLALELLELVYVDSDRLSVPRKGPLAVKAFKWALGTLELLLPRCFSHDLIEGWQSLKIVAYVALHTLAKFVDAGAK